MKTQPATGETYPKSDLFNKAPQGIKWSDIESLVKALGGEIKEGRGSRCKFILNMSVACFHRPHPSPDTDKGAVESVRDWLLSIGVKP
ncbi:type II toxin-antitoxin system HicA family toxin [Escherichia coli]|nr:type II toxin-antitoxin system HicA family toxin [Escherichia coli]MCR2875458.1 type II toxin-antitoxin system HicA family toxin [Escherichia coli]